MKASDDANAGQAIHVPEDGHIDTLGSCAGRERGSMRSSRANVYATNAYLLVNGQEPSRDAAPRASTVRHLGSGCMEV